MLHQHDGYEVLIFYCGDAEFIVEGSVYALRPFDVVIARENEMHRIFHRSPCPMNGWYWDLSLFFFSRITAWLTKRFL